MYQISRKQRYGALEWPLITFTKTYQIGSEIDAEDGDSSEGQRDVGEDEDEEGTDLRDVTGQGVCDRLLEIVKDQTACKTTSKYQYSFRLELTLKLNNKSPINSLLPPGCQHFQSFTISLSESFVDTKYDFN